MRGWRIKLVSLLIVYFAGFATAIYTLAPAPDNHPRKGSGGSLLDSAFKSNEFAKSFNSGMHKCIDFGKDAACRVAKTLKEKIDEKQRKTDG